MNVISGRKGEDIAVKILQKKGFKVLERNLRNIGGEVDIIAVKNECLYFVEVKARKDDRYGVPEQAVNQNKIKRIQNAGLFYRMQHDNLPEKMQILVISIIIQNRKAKYKIIDVG